MDMENTIQEMETQGVQSYILDLRNNPASSLTLLLFNLYTLKVNQFALLSSDVSVLFLFKYIMQGGLVTAGLDVAQIWLDGDETLVNTIDRDGNMLPISMVDGHAVTHDPLVVLVS